MPETPNTKSPREVADILGVTSTTIRQWEQQFAGFFSPDAQEKGRRRYTEQDLQVFTAIKNMAEQNLDSKEMLQRLQDEFAPDKSASRAVVSPTSPASRFLEETMHTLASGQQAVLNSQAANRELIGVLIQDNFNLKEENAHLRERILKVERELASLRREEDTKIETFKQDLEARFSEMQYSTANLQQNSGCLGGLFGGKSNNRPANE